MIGDHIRTLKAGHWTHAIDCGDETVIVLAEDAVQPPRVRRSYRPEFVAGAQAVEVVLHRERTFPAEEVVARAYSRIADPTLASMFRDSEAFAEWCTTGRLPAAAPNVAVAVPDLGRGVPPPAARIAARAPAPKAKARTKSRAKASRSARPAGKAKAAAAKPAAKARRTARKAGRVTRAAKPKRRARR